MDPEEEKDEEMEF
jgi:hypothetical protein